MRNAKLYGNEIASSEITPHSVFETGRPSRRAFLSGAGALTASSLLSRPAFADDPLTITPGKFQATDPQTPFAKATTYNNFYEYGVDKDLPAKNAHTLHTRPWGIQVSGLVKKPLTVGIDDLLHYRPLEIPRLPPSLRRSLVDDHPVGRLLAVGVRQLLQASAQRQVHPVYLAAVDRKHDARSPQMAFDWPYSRRASAWMKPCTRLR